MYYVGWFVEFCTVFVLYNTALYFTVMYYTVLYLDLGIVPTGQFTNVNSGKTSPCPCPCTAYKNVIANCSVEQFVYKVHAQLVY